MPPCSFRVQMAHSGQCLPPRSKIIDAEFGPQRLSFRCGLCVERRSCGVCNAVDGVEETCHAGSIDKCGLSHLTHDIAASPRKPLVVGPEQRLGKFDQQRTIDDACVSDRNATRDGLEIEGIAGMLAARTEQLRMPGRSISTLIKG